MASEFACRPQGSATSWCEGVVGGPAFFAVAWVFSPGADSNRAGSGDLEGPWPADFPEPVSLNPGTAADIK